MRKSPLSSGSRVAEFGAADRSRDLAQSRAVLLRSTLSAACAVASGVAVEFIACQARAGLYVVTLAPSQEPQPGNLVGYWDIPLGGAGGADREQAPLTGQSMELNGWTSPQMLRRYGASARNARARAARQPPAPADRS